MNRSPCEEYRDQFAAFVEGCLDEPAAGRLKSHLADCPPCQAEFDELRRVQGRLLRDAQLAANASMETHVMNQILRRQAEELRRITMRKQYKFVGTGAAVAAVCIALLVAIWTAMPDNRARAAEVLARGARTVSGLRNIHIKCMMRTLPADNFAYLAVKHDLVPIELWKEFGEQGKWRIEKPQRVVVMDGESTIMLIADRLAVKIGPSQGAFDTGWLHNLAAVDKTIADELSSALEKGRDLKLTHQEGSDDSGQQVVTVEVESGLDDSDYLKNKFFMDADTQHVYRFDAETGQLAGIEIYCHTPDGDVLVLETTEIDYDQAIDPAVFSLEVPEDVKWYQEPQRLPDNEKYEQMTPEQAARAFFEACSQEDWDEVRKFWTSSLDDPVKAFLGGLEIIKIGTPFQSKRYPGWFVPYEIKLKSGQVRKHNLALKKRSKANRFIVDGGL